MLLGRKAMTNLHSILKSRNITLPAKVHLVQAMVFPVGKYRCDTWTIKEAECWRIVAFELVVLKKSFESQVWTSSQSVLKKSVRSIHWKDRCWRWNSNTLATWCEELTYWKRPWCWERLKAGGEGDDRGWDSWMASLSWWTWVWACSGRWWWTGKPGVLQSMGLQRVRHDWATVLN